ncbi:ABC transporter permease [Alkalicella caledoniensis]|uniref:ABC transporter permease n=1 Tax=Alkalicella caledoniensis TaxID=2731377 RepID=A0A7G9WAQ1_ALKCA|nr:ABC transporter permease [Alkalicella caledoniensis]
MEIINSFVRAFQLIFEFDKGVYEIILLSLYVSLSSTVISTIMGVPLGIFLGLKDFRGKKVLIRIIYSLMSTPPVIVGLAVFLVIARKGPLGFLGLTYTPPAMVIAQVVLVTPIVVGLVFNNVVEKGSNIRNMAFTLGANKLQTLVLLLNELRSNILVAVTTGYGRAISEVGAVMIVGGNIRGHTRVMTTSIAMLRSMGDYETAIALGLVLLLISFIINSIIYNYQRARGV